MPTPTYVQDKFLGAGGTGSTTETITFTSNVTAGNLIVAYWHSGGSAPVVSCSDTLSNTYNLAGSFTLASQPVSVYYAYNITGGACTVTFSFGSNTDAFGGGFVVEYSGIMSSASPLDGIAAFGSLSGPNPINSGSLTTTASGDLLVGLFFDNNQGVGNSSDGFTLRDTGSFSQDALKDLITTSPGSYSAISSTGAGSQEWAVGVAFKALIVTNNVILQYLSIPYIRTIE